MIKIIEVLGKFVKRALVCFALVILGFICARLAIGNEHSAVNFDINQMLVLFYFSCLFSLSFTIASFIKNSAVIRRTVQFVLSFLSCFVIIFSNSFVSEGQNPAFRILLIGFVFVVIYAVCSAAVLISGYVYNKLVNGGKEYVNMFDEQKK